MTAFERFLIGREPLPKPTPNEYWLWFRGRVQCAWRALGYLSTKELNAFEDDEYGDWFNECYG